MATGTVRQGEGLVDDRPPLVTWAGLVALAAVLSAAAQRQDGGAFRRLLGAVPPAELVAGLGLVALGLLATPFARRWFPVHGAETARGVRRACGAALAFGAVVISADLLVVFPADLNVPFPGSLLFYPAVAFLAEALFHVVPLLLVTLLLVRLRGEPVPVRWMSRAVFLLALLEPAFQALSSAATGSGSVGAAIFVAIHVYLINVVQLGLFRRFDFISMLAFRLLYYAIWHVAWGHFRLQLLV